MCSKIKHPLFKERFQFPYSVLFKILSRTTSKMKCLLTLAERKFVSIHPYHHCQPFLNTPSILPRDVPFTREKRENSRKELAYQHTPFSLFFLRLQEIHGWLCNKLQPHMIDNFHLVPAELPNESSLHSIHTVSRKSRGYQSTTKLGLCGWFQNKNDHK